MGPDRLRIDGDFQTWVDGGPTSIRCGWFLSACLTAPDGQQEAGEDKPYRALNPKPQAEPTASSVVAFPRPAASWARWGSIGLKPRVWNPSSELLALWSEPELLSQNKL